MRYPDSQTSCFISKENGNREINYFIDIKIRTFNLLLNIKVIITALKWLSFLLIAYVFYPIASWTREVACKSWLEIWQKELIVDKIL